MRRPLILSTLLALGVMPPLPTPRREVNLADAEKLIADLQAAGIDACEVVNITGTEDFVMKGRLALKVHEVKRSMGEHDVSPLSLLAVVDELLAGEGGDPHGIGASLLPHIRQALGAVGLYDVAPARRRIPSPSAQHRERVAMLGSRIAHPDTTSAEICKQAMDSLSKSLDRLAPAAASLTESMRGLASATRRISTTIARPARDRSEQRAVKKTRARTKARRGW